MRLSKAPFPIRIAGNCIGIPDNNQVIRVIVFQNALEFVKPDPFGVTATERGLSPMVSMRYWSDQRWRP